MTRPRKRRPTFSGPQSFNVDHRPSMQDESDTSQDGLMSGRLNQRRGGKYAPSSFVERWIRRNSLSQAERPMLSHNDRTVNTDNLMGGAIDEDDDFGVGIPIENLTSRNTPSHSDSDSLKSKPSTRRSSMDSSIDDVCMPLDDEEKESGETQGVWPDTAVLDEFAAKELEEQANAEAAALVRESVNEAADAVKDGRLRPNRYAPWDKSNVLRTQSNMRFTYFRDDLPATVHSPSIAGLLHVGQTFADLFPHPQYAPPMSMTDSMMQSMPPTQVATQSTAGPAQGAAANGAGSKLASMGPSPGPAAGSGAAPGAPPSVPTAGLATGTAGVAATPPVAKSTPSSHVDSPAPSIDPGIKESFPDIQPDAAVMARLQPPPPPSHRTGTAASTETSAEEMGPWWLDVNSPTEEEMRVLSRAFGIHPLTTEDIILHEKREKVELFHNYYFVCFTSFDVKAWESGNGGGNGTRNDIHDEDNHMPNGASTERRRRGSISQRSHSSSKPSKRRRTRIERLKPLAVFSIVFKTGIITVHYRPTPHTINVRRRIRLLRDYLNVSSDWISYALIDDITDGYGPLINAVDEDVQGIDDAIMHMHGSHSDSEDDSDDENNKSVVSSSTGTSSTGYREWREKGNMLRWIGETRKRVMSLLSLLGNKADVIKGFSKRVGDQWSGAPRSEIAMYLSDIQDHLVTMTQSLNHYEKQLARSHSNYLAQINIDMTRTNNEMNDVLSKISVLGTIVLPMNIVTGLWGMNVLVPGQRDEDTLAWFYGIVIMMVIFGVSAYFLIMRFV